MKKQLFAFIFALAVTVVINVTHAYAQDSLAIRVNVPFTFTANDRTLPAGIYRINPASDSRVAWRILGEDRDLGSAFLLARTLSSGKQSDPLRLTFHRYGDMSFLVGFNTPSYAVDLPTTKGEKALRRVGSKVAKETVTVMETVEGGSH